MSTYLYLGLNSLHPAYLIVGDKYTGLRPQVSGRDFSVYFVIDDVKILHDPLSLPKNRLNFEKFKNC